MIEAINHPEVFFRGGFLKNVLVKYPDLSLFFDEVAAPKTLTSITRRFRHVFFCKFYKNTKNAIFLENQQKT